MKKLLALICLSLLTPLVAAQTMPERLPQVALTDLSGSASSLQPWQGKTLLINFWATWCPPCVEEIPLFADMRERLKGENFELIGINMWDEAESARQFVEKRKLAYPVLIGDDSTAQAFGDFQALPISFLVGADGRIVKRYYAVDAKSAAEMEKEIRQVLASGTLAESGGGLSNISLLTAFLAGILSFLSPCVLPLVPSYVSFITGISHEELTSADGVSPHARRTMLLHSVLFVLGFSIIFILLGASATFVGGLFTEYRSILEKVVGVVIVIFGLHISGIWNLKFLLFEKKMHLENKPLGMLGTLLVGFSFGVGWTPCIGPILGSILGFAATVGNLSAGMILLAAYSLGLGLPFLASAVAVQSFFAYFKKIRRYIPKITFASGIFLVLVGLLIFTGYFVKLAIFFQAWVTALFPSLGKLG